MMTLKECPVVPKRKRTYMIKPEHFYLVFQPIVRISKQDTFVFEEFEVLLRSAKTTKFPAHKFNEILANESAYNKYIEWFKSELEQKLREYPNFKFSINLDIDQFRFVSTFHFLDYFSQYHDQLIIEITERMPKNSPRLIFELECILKGLKHDNYKIAIDDYTEGVNTLALFKDYHKYYDRVKISLTGYKSIMHILLLVLYVKTMRLLFSRKVEIVVERVDSLRKSKIINRFSVCLQQGYYFRANGDLAKQLADQDLTQDDLKSKTTTVT